MPHVLRLVRLGLVMVALIVLDASAVETVPPPGLPIDRTFEGVASASSSSVSLGVSGEVGTQKVLSTLVSKDIFNPSLSWVK